MRGLSEAPIVKVPRDYASLKNMERVIPRNMKRLSRAQHETLIALHIIHGDRHSQALGIAGTSVFPLGSSASEAEIFLKASNN